MSGRPKAKGDNPARGCPDDEVEEIGERAARVSLEACEDGGAEDPADAPAVERQDLESTSPRRGACLKIHGTVVPHVGRPFSTTSLSRPGVAAAASSDSSTQGGGTGRL